MLIKSVKGKTPSYGLDCFFAENSTLVGDVKMGREVSVWYQAVVRGCLLYTSPSPRDS